MGLCEPTTTNTAQPVSVILRLYQLFDQNDNWVLPTPDPVKQVVKEPIPIGYTIRLDVTAKDAEGKDTLGKKDIQFIYSDPDHGGRVHPERLPAEDQGQEGRGLHAST